MYKLQKYLQSQKYIFSKKTKDGRINSCIDEDEIIKLLILEFGTRIKHAKIRNWYDILAYDNIYGWIPIDIKITTTKTTDNIGNLTSCVYAYTNEDIDINKKNYKNGKMSIILCDKLEKKAYNNNRDYYYLVINKTNITDIIINSMKGLTILSPNVHNLPFQICWNKNREFKYEKIDKKIKLFIMCIQNTKPSWKETFLTKIRKIKIKIRKIKIKIKI